jgi:multidrug efflux pump subunit AcrA (membrane-fusion protein)
MTSTKVVAGAVLLAVLGGAVFTQEPSPSKKEKPGKSPAAEGPKPAAHKVEKKTFRIELTVKGILEPEETAEIAYRPHPVANQTAGQGPLTLRKIVEHGSKVHKGDVLAALDTRKIDQSIDDLEAEVKGTEANIKLAEEELPLFQKSMPVELETATRGKKRADEDLKYYLEVGRPLAEKEADFFLKSAKYALEYAQEELRQLEKMYKANDLTEETEKIILKRQRHWVERAAFWLKTAEIDHEYTFKVTLPRKEKDLREGVVKQSQLLDKAKNTLQPQAAQKQEALAKLRHEHAKHLTQLAQLRKDREAMTMAAPLDGIVYHGKFHKGQWSLAAGQESKLVVEGSVTPSEVFLTVVKARPLSVRLQVEEKDVHLLKPDLAGKATVAFDPDRKLAARVKHVSPVPAAPGKYDVLVALDGAGPELMPGMGCSIKFVPYSKKDALVVPAGAVVEEDDKHFVTVVSKAGKKERREVTPGRSHEEQTEILSGLREGEEVLREPAEKTTPPAEKTTPKGGKE